MPLKKLGYALACSAVLAVGASQISYADEKADAMKAIEKAEQQLAAASSAGAVWQLIDQATGSGSQPLDKLLGIAKKKQEEGDYAEAMRIAGRVTEAASLGLEQIESQKGKAAPFYN